MPRFRYSLSVLPTAITLIALGILGLAFACRGFSPHGVPMEAVVAYAVSWPIIGAGFGVPFRKTMWGAGIGVIAGIVITAIIAMQ